jgi:hypothetical protein
MEKGKTVELSTMEKATLVNFSRTEKGNIRFECKETGMYYIVKPGEMMENMYKDWQKGLIVELSFTDDSKVTNSYKREEW